jgi:hypothetical protein
MRLLPANPPLPAARGHWPLARCWPDGPTAASPGGPTGDPLDPPGRRPPCWRWPLPLGPWPRHAQRSVAWMAPRAAGLPARYAPRSCRSASLFSFQCSGLDLGQRRRCHPIAVKPLRSDEIPTHPSPTPWRGCLPAANPALATISLGRDTQNGQNRAGGGNRRMRSRSQRLRDPRKPPWHKALPRSHTLQTVYCMGSRGAVCLRQLGVLPRNKVAWLH